MKYTLLASNYKEPPSFVINSSIDAESPYHAGLLFGKEMHSGKTMTNLSIVISDTKKKQYEVHLKKRKANEDWIFFGQVHKRKVKGTFALRVPIPAPIPINSSLSQGNNDSANVLMNASANNGQKNNASANNGQKNNASANNGQKNNASANNGQKNNASANNGQKNNASANNGQKNNASANNGQKNNASANNGQRNKNKALP
jgi:hypothetical protein